MSEPTAPRPRARPRGREGWAGLLLAGGRSRRMGRDKLSLRLPSGERLVDRPAAALRAVCQYRLLGGGPDTLRMPGFTRIADARAGAGPLAGIAAGLDWAAAHGCRWLLVLAGDLPEVRGEDLALLQDEADEEPALALWAAGPAGPEPLLGAWPVHLRETVHARLTAGELAVRTALPLEARRLRAYSDGDRMLRGLRNLNEPGDWEAYTGRSLRPEPEQRA